MTDSPGSAVVRPNLDRLPLGVGPASASHGTESSFIAFRNFRLTTRK